MLQSILHQVLRLAMAVMSGMLNPWLCSFCALFCLFESLELQYFLLTLCWVIMDNFLQGWFINMQVSHNLLSTDLYKLYISHNFTLHNPYNSALFFSHRFRGLCPLPFWSTREASSVCAMPRQWQGSFTWNWTMLPDVMLGFCFKPSHFLPNVHWASINHCSFSSLYLFTTNQFEIQIQFYVAGLPVNIHLISYEWQTVLSFFRWGAHVNKPQGDLLVWKRTTQAAGGPSGA